MTPLQGSLRVLDVTRGWQQGVGQLLAELGADVLLLDEPSMSDGWQLRNRGKVSVSTPSRSVDDLARQADLVIDDGQDRELPERLLAASPRLVVVTVTDFGRTGPYRDWRASEGTLAALGGVLSRSGVPGLPPVLPPAGLVRGTANAQAAWAAMVAVVKALRTGVGELVDVSAYEAVVHALDPGFGTQGTAAAGRADTFPRGRPDARNYYPVFDCADGQVRICLLAPRQWQAMFEWLGEPAELASPELRSIPGRFAVADLIHPFIARLFADKRRDDLLVEAARRGIPIASILDLDTVRRTAHFIETGALSDVDLPSGNRLRVAAGNLRWNGERATLSPPELVSEWPVEPPNSLREPQFAGSSGRHPRRPLDGLRVLDLGVIVFGAELGRMLADQGAEVIKVENTTFPDGLRQSRRGRGISVSFAWGHRNKSSLGLDLRDSRGRRLFEQLVADSDVLLSNFKPGTLDGLGLGAAELLAINPRLVVSEGSAFGSSGPWSQLMGYGPLVRAACGITDLWRDPLTGEPCDGITVYPDHAAALVAATGVLAGLLGRERHDRGGRLEIAQCDVALMQLSALSATDSDRADVVLPCAGDDDWLVVAGPTQSPGQLASEVAQSTASDAMISLQLKGIAAGMMYRLPEELTDVHLLARGSFATLTHPDIDQPVPASARPARFSTIPDAAQSPAPTLGQQTEQIAKDLLGLSAGAIAELLENGVLIDASISCTELQASGRQPTPSPPA